MDVKKPATAQTDEAATCEAQRIGSNRPDGHGPDPDGCHFSRRRQLQEYKVKLGGRGKEGR